MGRRDMRIKEDNSIQEEVLDGLNASSRVENIDWSLTKEQEEWVNDKIPNDPFKNLSSQENLSCEEWQTSLVEKYQKLYDIVKEKLPILWDSLEFEISVQKILNIKDCTLPFAGIVLGKPSSLKSVGIGMFRNWKNSVYSDHFSAKSFVSHSTAVKNKKELEQIDLLPKIKNKLFLTPELSPTFTKKDEDLIEILGILTRILDGEGYESDTGAHGHRGYHGEYMFAWIGAAVDIPYKVHKHLGNLGAKLYFLRLLGFEKDEDGYLQEINKDDFIHRTKVIQEVLLDYLGWFEKCPIAVIDNNNAKIEWNFGNDEEDAKRFIIRLGRLLAHLRGVVPTWETRDSQGTDYAYTFPNIEDPSRAIRQLMNLARGHALSQGRNFITKNDIQLIVKVVLSTASTERTRIFETLLNFGGELTTRQIMDYLNVSAPTARRTMTELMAIGVVERETITGETGGEMFLIKLADGFKWFLSEEFKNLKTERKNFSPHSIQDTIQNNRVQEVDGGNFSFSRSEETSE